MSSELATGAANSRVSYSHNRLFDGLGDMPVGFAVGGDVGHSSGGGIGSNGNDVGAVVSGVRGIGHVDDGGVDKISRARKVHR